MLTLLLVESLAAPIGAAAAFDALRNSFEKTGTEAGYAVTSEGKPAREFVSAWAVYLNGFLVVMGLLFMVLVIYGGYLWMSAQGKEEQVTRGKDLIIQAVIGLAIVIGARIIVELAILTLGDTVQTS
ncbi:MAG: hypothetical protein A2951_01260 [Candidatus Buchananbacteria bacterium RIFCSPLOWO2_01_FULL_56_15]|uniref:Uncharacterized protein n=2 Tax=Candidatus Buchananiibacteriota TaxID=1817903 RepID=A0A1G1YHL8_9BACT|nr:MAG: hypothetical protein A3J59_04835 [Candidatus Buchananbacteria bacterium RIFCSPHIGHO2_02_FULL_56_16]OGY54643.1 MAG: hypothetical protein A2951_01260 [Candidatus Buchananbacteria bacterium RIFCSPLOWO2_01_FULL_56_15]